MIEKEIGVIGRGFVGTEVINYLRQKGFAVIDPSSKELDITNQTIVDDFVRNFGGNSIVLSAALTNVNLAQTELMRFIEVNVEGAINFARACTKYGKHLIYFSSDFVFDGSEENPGPYPEDGQKADLSSSKIGNYGWSKSAAEDAIKSSGCKAAIVRLSFPFGNLNSTSDYINKLLFTINKNYPLYENQQITPTYLKDLVEAVEIIAKKQLTGIFHVATHPPTTPYELGFKINEIKGNLQIVKVGVLTNPIEISQVSPRPIKGGLLTTKTEERLEIGFHSWKDAIDEQF